MNERLARHYGIDGVSGPSSAASISRHASRRRAHAGERAHRVVYATRTSPVLRGKWILDNLLNALRRSAGRRRTSTRTIGTCVDARAVAGAPAEPDVRVVPPANGSPVRASRTSTRSAPSHRRRQVPDRCLRQAADGSTTGPDELRAVLRSRPEPSSEALTSKLLTYALGRGLERYDRRTVKESPGRLRPATTGSRRSSWKSSTVCRFSSSERADRASEARMIVTGRHLPRRMFLKGMGAAIAPGIGCDDPRLRGRRRAWPAGRKRSAPSRVHLRAQRRDDGGLDAVRGGRAGSAPRILKLLEPFREDTLILSGLAHKNGNALGDGPGDHARAAASYLTGVHPRKTAGADIQNGVSVDQVAAKHLSGRTRLSSLELGCDDSRTVGNCDSRYVRLYQQPRVARTGDADAAGDEPRLVFERLFGDIDTSVPADVRAPSAAPPQHSRPRERPHRRADGGARSVRQAQAGRIPLVDPRDRAPHRTLEKDMTGLTLASTSRPASRCSTPITST